MSFPAEKEICKLTSFLPRNRCSRLIGLESTYLVLSQGGGRDDRDQEHEVYLPSITLVQGFHKPSLHSLPHLSFCHFYLKQLTNSVSEYHVNSTTHEHSLLGHVELLHLHSCGRYPQPEVHRQFLVLTEGESKVDCFWHCKHNSSFKRTSWTSYPSTFRGNFEQ